MTVVLRFKDGRCSECAAPVEYVISEKQAGSPFMSGITWTVFPCQHQARVLVPDAEQAS